MKLVYSLLAVGVLGLSSAFYVNMKPVHADNAIITNTKPNAVSNTHGYKVDVENSIVGWVGSKPTGKHSGTLKLNSGALHADNDLVASGNFILNMSSINCTDLSGKGKESLEGHLKSADFFGIEKNPTATFDITEVKALEVKPEGLINTDATHTIAGNLTLLGVSKGVSFPAQVIMADGKIAVKASFNIDRTEWGMTYGAEGKVAKEINLTLDLKASN
jgi:polyisoprenoid-binding protein YceI